MTPPSDWDAGSARCASCARPIDVIEDSYARDGNGGVLCLGCDKPPAPAGGETPDDGGSLSEWRERALESRRHVRDLSMGIRVLHAYPKSREKRLAGLLDYCVREGLSGNVLRTMDGSARPLAAAETTQEAEQSMGSAPATPPESDPERDARVIAATFDRYAPNRPVSIGVWEPDDEPDLPEFRAVIATTAGELAACLRAGVRGPARPMIRSDSGVAPAGADEDVKRAKWLARVIPILEPCEFCDGFGWRKATGLDSFSDIECSDCGGTCVQLAAHSSGEGPLVSVDEQVLRWAQIDARLGRAFAADPERFRRVLTQGVWVSTADAQVVESYIDATAYAAGDNASVEAARSALARLAAQRRAEGERHAR